MCGLVFIIVRFPVFLIAVIVVSLFWLACFSFIFVVLSVMSVFVLVVCAFTNNPDAMQKWVSDFGETLRVIIVHLIEGNIVCWKFLIGHSSNESTVDNRVNNGEMPS